MKNNYCCLLVFLIVGCEVHDELDTAPANSIQITSASELHKEAFKSWIGSKDIQARYALQEYDAADLVEISDNRFRRWAVPKKGDPSTSLSFIITPAKKIEMAFISTAVKNPDNSIRMKFYTPEKRLVIDALFNHDGSTNVISRDIPVTMGWWSEFDYCLGKVLSPFESNAANVAMDLVFSAATLNMWVPAVALSCAGFGLARM